MRLIKALIKRWFYLLFVGMWRGECAYTVTNGRGRIKIVGSGKPTDIPGVFRNYKIWYA